MARCVSEQSDVCGCPCLLCCCGVLDGKHNPTDDDKDYEDYQYDDDDDEWETTRNTTDG